MQATINGDGVIIEAEHGGGPRVIITFKDGVVINETLAADFGVRLLGGVGPRGPRGYYFTPGVDDAGNISWSNNGGLPNPETKNIKGPRGLTGPVYTPGVDASGNISWTNDGGLPNPETKNIKGPRGLAGPVFTPSVDSSGNISWTNDGGLPNPETRNITGPRGDTYVLTAQDKADIAALVEAELTGDTGWVDISGYADTSVITPTASRFHARCVFGKICHLSIRFTFVGNLAANTSLTITNAIPAQFRPRTTIRALLTASEAGGCWFDVQADGTLRVYSRNQAIPANGYVSGDVVYTVNAPVSE